MGYGTVMVAWEKPGAEEQLREGGRRRVAERAPVVRRLEDEWMTFVDHGTVVIAARFASTEHDAALADDLSQDAFSLRHLGPHVEDIRWIDGSREAPIRAREQT